METIIGTEYKLKLPIKILLTFMTITSFLVAPSIQGTTIAYLFCFLSPLVVFFMSIKRAASFYKDLFILLSVYVFLVLLSQLSLSFSDITLFPTSKLLFIDEFSQKIIFRSSLFTQSLYLVVSLIFFALTINFYTKKWDKYFLISATILCLYGLYEWSYFLITGQNGDFLTNRSFETGLDDSGSLFQVMHIGALNLARIKSLTGEPSMFALSMVPFFYYAYYNKRFKLALLFIVCIILSFSTTAYIGVAVFLLAHILNPRRWVSKNYLISVYTAVLTGLITCWIIGFSKIGDVLYDSIFAKLATDSDSTSVRTKYFFAHLDYFSELPILNKLFGIGFGYVRSTDFFSTLLVNTGIIGFIVFSLLFLVPVFKLKTKTPTIRAVRLSLIFIYISMLIAVPEFSYLSVWLFLGMAYYYLRQQRV